MDIRVALMALIRVSFGLASLVGGLLMLIKNDIQLAIRINSIIGSIGPLIFLSVSALGVVGLSNAVHPGRLALLLTGVLLVFWETQSN